MPFAMKMPLEVPIALLIFGWSLSDSVTTNWLLYKTCDVIMHINKTECELLGTKHADNFTIKLEETVQPYVTVITMSKSLLESFFAAFICLFMGSWSDTYGRKPVILLTLGAYTLVYLILAIICTIPRISPWFILLCSIPICCCGGMTVFFAAILCYLADITTHESRGFRMNIFYSIVTAATVVGLLLSSDTLKALGFAGVYVVSTGAVFLGCLMTYLFLPESVENPETEHKYRNFFKVASIQDTVKTAFKPRENLNRALVFLIMAILVLYVLTTLSVSITYLYLQRELSWTLQKYNMYSCVSIVVQIIGSGLAIYGLNKLLGINESCVIMIGLISSILGSLCLATAGKDWHVYEAGFASLFMGTISPMGRTLLSKIVTSNDHGKIFAFLAICETVIGPLGTPMYTYVYNNTITYAPGAYNYVISGFTLVGIILCTTIIIIQRRNYAVPVPYLVVNE